MQARGALMIEHRLIERMVGLLGGALSRIEADASVDPLFIDAVVDFISTYADRTHHGKEEDILFRELDKKDLTPDDRALMNKLLEEHRVGRSATKAIAVARNRYCEGDSTALADISQNLRTLMELYPQHIEKEDKVFFPASRTYLSDPEDQAMRDEFEEFDRKMIHEKYNALVQRLESDPPPHSREA